MSKDGISKANHNLYSDENTRYSHLKDVDIRLFEKTFRNKLKDLKNFTGVILRLEASKNIVATYGGSVVFNEQPIFYQAWIRVEGVHDEVLPNPCSARTVEEEQYLISLHGPPALSAHISAQDAGRYNLRAGQTVECEYNPGPNANGSQQDFIFKPSSVGPADLKEYPCLERKTALIRGGFAKKPQLTYKANVSTDPSTMKEVYTLQITDSTKQRVYPTPSQWKGKDHTKHGSKPNPLRTITTPNGLQSRPHRGLDIPSDDGVPILNFHEGEVVKVAYGAKGYGHSVEIRHDNIQVTITTRGKTYTGPLHTRYAHLRARTYSKSTNDPNKSLQKGDKVPAGYVLGMMGTTGNSTGVHLHWGASVGGKYSSHNYDFYKDLLSEKITSNWSVPTVKPKVYIEEGTKGVYDYGRYVVEFADWSDGNDGSTTKSIKTDYGSIKR